MLKYVTEFTHNGCLRGKVRMLGCSKSKQETKYVQKHMDRYNGKVWEQNMVHSTKKKNLNFDEWIQSN